MSKQTYPQYRAMAFSEKNSRGEPAIMLDRWHTEQSAAMVDAFTQVADGFRAVVFRNDRTSRHVVTETLVWESDPGTQTWLDEEEQFA